MNLLALPKVFRVEESKSLDGLLDFSDSIFSIKDRIFLVIDSWFTELINFLIIDLLWPKKSMLRISMNQL
jgi:hypothetical protein